MRKKIFFGVFLAVCTLAIIYWLTYIREVKVPVSSAVNAIPANAAFILESHQSRATWKKLSQTNIMWEELLGTATFASLNLQARTLDSLLQLDPAAAGLLEGYPVLISAHATGPRSFSFLFTYSLPNLTRQSDLEDFILRVNKEKEPPEYAFRGVPVRMIRTENKKELYYSFLNGTIMASFEQQLVHASILQLQSGRSLMMNMNFSKIMDAAGSKVDANLYVQYSSLPGILNRFIPPLITKGNPGIASFAECSGWDITLKPNAVMLSGFTRTNDSIPTFLASFSNQKPQQIELPKVIPANTALMMYYGISDMRSFQRDLHRFHIARKTHGPGLDPAMASTLLQWMNNELALVITEPASDTLDNNLFAVIRSNNAEEALASLGSLSDSLSSDKEQDTSSYKGHRIRSLDIPEILPGLFGPLFSKIRNDYYTAVEDYIVFGRSPEALHSFIRSYESNKTLKNDRNYKSFSENISEEANFYVYASMGRSEKIFAAGLEKEFASELGSRKELLGKFEATALQFSRSNGAFYSNVYIKYNPEHKKEASTLWELKLDSTVSMKPTLLINHKTRSKDVFIQDDANKIYLISNTGKIIWTKQLHEKIMSEVMQVDVLKNDKLQILFNTRSAIYLYDRNGNDMKGFPVSLTSAATSPVTLVDYDKNREYRIFVACEDRRIRCYTAEGELLKGFHAERTAAPVYLPVHYFRSAGKDHLCAVDAGGKIYVLNRQGEVRVEMKEKMPVGIRNFFTEPGKDYSRSWLISADTLGNIIRISLSGEKENIKMQDFETSPYFEYADLHNDKTKEFIFLTRKELKVFSQDRSLLFRQEFEDLVSKTPLLFRFPDGKIRIGVVAEELYLFDVNGQPAAGFPINGSTLFSLGDLNNDGSLYLVTGSADNSIFVYQLPSFL